MATGTTDSVALMQDDVVGDCGGLTDGELLDCSPARREEAAFEVLVRRHGPMVLGVCRRLLPNECDAEDAFQATFRARPQGGNRCPCALVGNWLYGVAYGTALKAKATTARRLREAGADHARDPDGTQGPLARLGRRSTRCCSACRTSTVCRSCSASWKAAPARKWCASSDHRGRCQSVRHARKLSPPAVADWPLSRASPRPPGILARWRQTCGPPLVGPTVSALRCASPPAKRRPASFRPR